MGASLSRFMTNSIENGPLNAFYGASLNNSEEMISLQLQNQLTEYNYKYFNSTIVAWSVIDSLLVQLQP